MDRRISLVTLGVADLARSRSFYEKLGWRASGPSDDSVAFFQAGGMILALWDRASLAADAGLDDKGGFGGIALAQNVASPAEVDNVLAEAELAGGQIRKPGHEAFWGGYTGYFTDPDGHPWEIAWNPGFTILADGSVKLPD